MATSDIRKVTMVGAGNMGTGIGQTFARAGFPVTLYDVSPVALQRAPDRIRETLQELSELGGVRPDEIDATLGRVTTTSSLETAVSEADLVIEAVFENRELKQDVFRQLDLICPTSVILASNTSGLMPSDFASAVRHSERVLVAHFFYPAYLLPLVEIVPHSRTAEDAVQKVYRALVAIGKSPIILRKEALGFVGTRLQMALIRECMSIVELGIATPEAVDIAVRSSFGRRLSVAGPFETAEVQDGWDLVLAAMGYIIGDLSNATEPSPLMRQWVSEGKLGAKSGGGNYDWPPKQVTEWKKKLYGALVKRAENDPKPH